MTSWKKTIATPFKKAATFFHQQTREKKPLQTGHERSVMDLHGEVMACAYEDVQVMWSILDKTNSPNPCNLTSLSPNFLEKKRGIEILNLRFTRAHLPTCALIESIT